MEKMKFYTITLIEDGTPFVFTVDARNTQEAIFEVKDALRAEQEENYGDDFYGDQEPAIWILSMVITPEKPIVTGER